MTDRLDRLEDTGSSAACRDPATAVASGSNSPMPATHSWLESTNAQAIQEALVAGALTKRGAARS